MDEQTAVRLAGSVEGTLLNGPYKFVSLTVEVLILVQMLFWNV